MGVMHAAQRLQRGRVISCALASEQRVEQRQLAGEIRETAPIGRAETAPLDLIARIWILELRRKAIIEIGGTSRPKDIWRCVRRGIETEAIRERDIARGCRPLCGRRVPRGDVTGF